jgi:hypothetical protein
MFFSSYLFFLPTERARWKVVVNGLWDTVSDSQHGET